MGGHRCAVKNCKNTTKNNSHVSFFRFPKDLERAFIYAVKCGREEFVSNGPTNLYRRCRICSDHFEHKMFTNGIRNRLTHDAMPTIFPCTGKYPKNHPLGTDHTYNRPPLIKNHSHQCHINGELDNIIGLEYCDPLEVDLKTDISIKFENHGYIPEESDEKSDIDIAFEIDVKPGIESCYAIDVKSEIDDCVEDVIFKIDDDCQVNVETENHSQIEEKSEIGNFGQVYVKSQVEYDTEDDCQPENKFAILRRLLTR